jgi:hypothetical protein
MFTFDDERGLLPVKSRDQFGAWLRITMMKLESLVMDLSITSYGLT